MKTSSMKTITVLGAHTHNSIGGSQNVPKLHNSKSSRHLNRLGYTMHPRGTSSWEHNAPKSNKLLKLQSHESSWRAQPDATNAKRQDHTKWSNPSLSNSNQETNALGGIREKEQRG